jgi:poly(hydroxyalkanoate) depolymerase family esterase
MNRPADEQGFIVVYPEQTAMASASKCWNWFKPEDQRRGAGEPSLIAGLVTEVAYRHGADSRRIFVAGLSAGAAMALVLGETSPELFAGVGVHAGLAQGSARDIPPAPAAMKGGRSGVPGLKSLGTAAPQDQAVQAVPVIVFRGDRDQTVRPSNGTNIVQQAQEAYGAQPATGSLQIDTQTGVSPGGRRYTRTVHADKEGRVVIESWTLHDAGHTCSGGHWRPAQGLRRRLQGCRPCAANRRF